MQNSYKTSIKGLTLANKELSFKINDLESWNLAVKRFFKDNNISLDDNENDFEENLDDFSESELGEYDDSDRYGSTDELRDENLPLTSNCAVSVTRADACPSVEGIPLFPDIIDSSCKYHFIKLALKSQQYNLQYLSQICQSINHVSAILVADWKDKHNSLFAEHMSQNAEMEHVLSVKSRMQEELENMLLKEDDLSLEIDALRYELSAKENQYRNALTNEECALMKCRQLDLEKCTARTMLEKVKCDLDGLRNDNERMKGIIHDLNGELEQHAETNIILDNELDKALQELRVANAERDELMKQFIENVKMHNN